MTMGFRIFFTLFIKGSNTYRVPAHVWLYEYVCVFFVFFLSFSVQVQHVCTVWCSSKYNGGHIITSIIKKQDALEMIIIIILIIMINYI